jgi:hypothetical protein
VILVVGGWFAYGPATNRYRSWKQQRALAQAEAFIAEADYNSAKLALDVALATVPGDPAALRVAADLLEQVGAPEVLPLRRRLIAIDPDSIEDRAALVVSSLRFDDLNGARDAMRDMTPEQANHPAALKAALAYALATNNQPIADVLYGRLSAIEPDNENLQVLHAVLRLKIPRPEASAAARAELVTFSAQPRHSLFVNRELMVDAMLRQDTAEAERLATLLAADPRATLADRLHGANLALNVARRPFPEVFAGLEPSVGNDPADVAGLVRWVVLVGHPTEAAAWLQDRSPEVQNHPSVRSARAEVATALADWDELAALVEAGAWGGTTSDTVRLAFSAHLAASRTNVGLKKQIWDEALLAAGPNLVDLSALYRLAAAWGWDDQIEQTLWAVTRAFPAQTWAHQTLFNVYRERKDTTKLLSLASTLRDADATTPRFQYDWALLTMLVHKRSTWSPEKQAVMTLYETDPANPHYATGYALALAQAQRPAEALAIVQKLSSAERSVLERAPYLAYIYSVAGMSLEAEEASAARPQLGKLLPEELMLFDQARTILADSRIKSTSWAKPDSSGN